GLSITPAAPITFSAFPLRTGSLYPGSENDAQAYRHAQLLTRLYAAGCRAIDEGDIGIVIPEVRVLARLVPQVSEREFTYLLHRGTNGSRRSCAASRPLPHHGDRASEGGGYTCSVLPRTPHARASSATEAATPPRSPRHARRRRRGLRFQPSSRWPSW